MNKVTLKPVLPRLGGMLRTVREKSGRKLADVAPAAGISVSMLSQIERGVVSPSIDSLCMVCRALDVEAAELFRRLSPLEPVRIHRSGERLKMENGGVKYEQLMTSLSGAFPVELFCIEIRPGRSTAMSGGGHEGTEMGFVLKGNGRLSVGDRSYSVKENDSLCFSAHLPHRLMNTGRKTFRAVWSIAPPHVDYLKNGK
ncbi:MAG: cupin domain-containing protein [Chitinispirillaceae bacterium]|nr:cupin domain-containing protein [Chitinispirillaceae bacterium]